MKNVGLIGLWSVSVDRVVAINLLLKALKKIFQALGRSAPWKTGTMTPQRSLYKRKPLNIVEQLTLKPVPVKLFLAADSVESLLEKMPKMASPA